MFSPITLADRDKLHPIIRQWNFENSDICFSNLLMWQPSIKTEYELTDDGLFIRFFTTDGRMIMQPPVLVNKDGDYTAILNQAISYFETEDQVPRFRGVTAPIRQLMEIARPNYFEFIHDRDNDDYVYDADKMRNLPGKKLHNKRNHIKKFLSFYPFEYEAYDSKKHADECLALNERWHEHKIDDEAYMEEDFYAIECSLRYASELGMVGGVVSINGQVEAFTLGEQITDDMALIHIEKANADIPGLYPFINQHFVETSWENMAWINREEDMGVANIRRAKESYDPERMIEKFAANRID